MRLSFNAQTSPPSAELLDDTAVVFSLNDGLDLIANADYLGARRVVASQLHFSADFFDLKTGLAGEILQKFVNYRMQLTVIGDWRQIRSNALRDFIRECNRGTAIEFRQA
ncbi:DUF4180 domain-containing protein [Reinekea blandensis]|uniref:DUF4180 domain-containing protein n=1 Tax=Reinekea blandensis MED297 TaxID=314283 RepID=A4B911_9GAMM|nr:DUF4180 domain-containing protein [Reinekea blandensis]EAR11112.1 hypothetical protein MED297_19532 [Reinekea sp. MED297] [Reinekea blandensis MED297]